MRANADKWQEKDRCEFAAAERRSPHTHQRRESFADACRRATQTADLGITADSADERHAH